MRIKILGILILTLILSACTHMPKAGSYADATTTYIGLSNGYAEANPILSWAGDPLTIALMSIGLKQGAKYALSPIAGECYTDRTIETFGMAGAGWNVGMMLSGYPPAAILAIISGSLYYNSSEDCDDNS